MLMEDVWANPKERRASEENDTLLTVSVNVSDLMQDGEFNMQVAQTRLMSLAYRGIISKLRTAIERNCLNGFNSLLKMQPRTKYPLLSIIRTENHGMLQLTSKNSWDYTRERILNDAAEDINT